MSRPGVRVDLREIRANLPGWLAGVALLAVGWLTGRGALQQALQGYLVAWLFCLALPLGSMAWLSIHRLTGGGWGRALHAHWQVAAGLLPWVALLGLPLVAGAPVLLPWVQASPGRTPVPHWYLNLPFLYLRLAGCMVLWLALARRQRRWSGIQPPRPSLASQGLAGVSLLLLLLTISLTGVDWVMSLVPQWHSTALGMLLMTCFLTIALALPMLAAIRGRPGRHATPDVLQLRRDLGNLLLACVLGWAYLAFMDYLTAWIADLPSETVWYLPRLQWPWRVLPLALLVLHLGVPLVALLPRCGKQNARVLVFVAALVLVMQFANLLWLVLPGLRPPARPLLWSDAFAWGGVAVVMAAAWRQAHRRMATINPQGSVA